MSFYDLDLELVGALQAHTLTKLAMTAKAPWGYSDGFLGNQII